LRRRTRRATVPGARRGTLARGLEDYY